MLSEQSSALHRNYSIPFFIVCVFLFFSFFFFGRRVTSKAQPRCVFMALIKSNNGAGAQQSALRTLAF